MSGLAPQGEADGPAAVLGCVGGQLGAEQLRVASRVVDAPRGQRLADGGVTINRPPRDGMMAFVRSPDRQSIELLQKGAALAPKEPWTSMPNTGNW